MNWRNAIFWGATLAVLTAAVGVLWSGVADYPHREDSFATMAVIDRIAAGSLPTDDPTFGRSPLGHLLMAVPVWLVGPSEYSYRAANLLFMLLTLLVVVKIGRDLGLTAAGVAAALFVAFSPIEGLIVSYVRFYAVFQFCFVFAWYMVSRFLATQQRSDLMILFAAIFVTFFVHKLALQLFVVLLIAFVCSGRWSLLKDRFFVGGSVLLLACAGLVFFSKSFTLAAEDYNEFMIGAIGSMFRSERPLFFYHEIKEYVPLAWSLTLWGILLAGLRKQWALLAYGLAYVVLFATIVVLAPGDGSYYYAHVFPVGVFFAFASLQLTASLLAGHLRARRWRPAAAVGLSPVIIAAGLLLAGLENVNPALAFGQGLKFHDQQPPHLAMKALLADGDIVLSTDAGLSQHYLGRPVLWLRQKADANDRLAPFPGREGDRDLVDSSDKLLALLRSTPGSVWIYGNFKYPQTVGQELKDAISRHVRQVAYYDEPGQLFVLRLSGD